MMSRERLMEGRGREHPRRRFTRVAKVHIEDARPGSVDRRILVTRKGSTAFEKGRHAADLNLCAGEFREEARQTPAHIVELCRDRRDQRRFSRLLVRIEEFGIDEQRHDTGRERQEKRRGGQEGGCRGRTCWAQYQKKK